ncbi:translation initiation factor eIF2b-like protein [Thermochaetoides thermophila DSM 1495]|uniref:Translation initiation factor eIF2B subunit beta n=1 Tax=Chaetomium thermophilum (strain DSM 1495 / CBS 144.50 / IMI 039719) TaxID=759272 RepID=G0SEE6_CHATD|nr:translation initiation factor eIF2b-like protein [Thermochaetoides thermophila DSM 1495]EGS18323.1 translation initiation factor eIF2b-like protein [Thermochaetoides thermophila DSM 1495]
MAPSQASHTPSLATWTKSLRDQSLEASIESLIFLLKRRQVTGDECAGAIAQLLRQVVAKSKWHDVDQLLYRVQTAGARLARAAPHEPVIGNIPRPEPASSPTTSPSPARTLTSGLQVSKSMFNLLSVADPSESPVTGASTPISQAQQPFSVHALRSEVMDGIEEILDEINQADDQIASFAEIQIHPGDYVLAYQPSKTVERFLVKAASKRRFTVILASLNPPAPGEEEQPYAALRKKLNAAGVSTINLASNGLMAYIPRVNKVIFGAKAVYQNGGLLVDSGACIAAQAAHEYLKPVIALCGVYKFCPEDPSDEVSRGELGNPSSYVSYADGPELDSFEVENTTTDYIPPDLVDVYLTNLGPQTRHHLGGIYADHYKIEDIGFSLQVGE